MDAEAVERCLKAMVEICKDVEPRNPNHDDMEHMVSTVTRERGSQIIRAVAAFFDPRAGAHRPETEEEE